jgi:hypothetical protein
MFETWTLAVLRLMNNASAISPPGSPRGPTSEPGVGAATQIGKTLSVVTAACLPGG